MTPAVEDGEDGEEEEDMAPLQEEVVRVESLQGAGGDDPQHHQVERKPGDQERSLPAAQTVASQAYVGRVDIIYRGEDQFTCCTSQKSWQIFQKLHQKESSLSSPCRRLKP